MTWFDYGVIAILGFSLLVGVLRGLLRELVMLIGWIAAFVLATAFSGRLTPMIPESLGPLLASLLAVPGTPAAAFTSFEQQRRRPTERLVRASRAASRVVDAPPAVHRLSALVPDAVVRRVLSG